MVELLGFPEKPHELLCNACIKHVLFITDETITNTSLYCGEVRIVVKEYSDIGCHRVLETNIRT